VKFDAKVERKHTLSCENW